MSNINLAASFVISATCAIAFFCSSADRVQFAALVVLCWNVGLDLGYLLKQRRDRAKGTAS